MVGGCPSPRLRSKAQCRLAGTNAITAISTRDQVVRKHCGVREDSAYSISKLQRLEWTKSQVQRGPPHSLSHTSQCPSYRNWATISDSARVSQRGIDGHLDRSSPFTASASLSIASARNQYS